MFHMAPKTSDLPYWPLQNGIVFTRDDLDRFSKAYFRYRSSVTKPAQRDALDRWVFLAWESCTCLPGYLSGSHQLEQEGRTRKFCLRLPAWHDMQIAAALSRSSHRRSRHEVPHPDPIFPARDRRRSNTA